jgi:hypothetical protein
MNSSARMANFEVPAAAGVADWAIMAPQSRRMREKMRMRNPF